MTAAEPGPAGSEDHATTRSSAPPTPAWVQALGWYGTAAIVGAYAAGSWGWLEPGPLYQLLNLTGAAGVGLVCWWRRAWQPFWLEVVWAAVAAAALARALL